MNSLTTTGTAALTAGLLLLVSASAQPPEPLPLEPPAGVEILGKGPVHEAFARPGDDRPPAGPVVVKVPPAAIEELPPDQKPEGSIWIPGYWQWDDERTDYLWISGIYRVPPPNRQWVAGQFETVEGGYRWIPGFWSSVPVTDLNYVPPPPQSIEAGPSTPAPQDDAFYISGSWNYCDDSVYRWRAGFWTAHRPGWVWCPTQYFPTPRGFVCNPGHWDVPLERRGLLFAANCITPNVLRPGFVFTPSYVVSNSFLPSALFVRTGRPCYYYGDYYRGGANFAFWADHRPQRGLCDPLFTYYTVGNRGWERDLRATYQGRVRGDLPLPPPTLTAQRAPAGQVNRPTPLVRLGRDAVPAGVKLTRVPQAERVVKPAPRSNPGPAIVNVAPKPNVKPAPVIVNNPPVVRNQPAVVNKPAVESVVRNLPKPGPVIVQEKPPVVRNQPAPVNKPAVVNNPPPVVRNQPAPSNKPSVVDRPLVKPVESVLKNVPTPRPGPAIIQNPPPVVRNQPAPVNKPVVVEKPPQARQIVESVVRNLPKPKPVILQNPPPVVRSQPAPVNKPVVVNNPPPVVRNQPAPVNRRAVVNRPVVQQQKQQPARQNPPARRR